MDIEKIEELLDLMEKYGLQEMEVEDEGRAFRFSRRTSCDHAQAPVVLPQVAQAGIAQAPAGAPLAASPAPSEDESLVPVKAPMVGTFYRASSPDDDPYIDVGDHVTDEAVVGIIEAMKVMNEVTADCAGTVRKILVNNGDPVEYGQVMFLIEPD